MKQRSDGVRFMIFQYEPRSTVMYAMKAMDRRSRQTRKERIAVVRHGRMSEVTSFTVASMERYFLTELFQ